MHKSTPDLHQGDTSPDTWSRPTPAPQQSPYTKVYSVIHDSSAVPE